MTDIKKKEETNERKFDSMRDWLRNVESRVTGGNRYYKGGGGGDGKD